MKLTRFLLAVAAVLGLASCLEIKSTVIVNKDGSALVEETSLLGAQLAAMMQGGGEQGAQLKGLVLDKEKAAERAKQLGEGVTVKSVEDVKSPDGKSGTKVVFAVADIRKLKYKPNTPDDKKEGGDSAMTFTLDGNKLTMNNPDADKKKGDGKKPAAGPEEIAQMKAQMAMMKPMFAGMRMTIEVKSAGGIASTDASHAKDDTVTIMDMQFDKIMENVEVFADLMQSSQDLSMAEAAKKFEKVDGLKIEGKKTVTVELK